MKLKSLCTNLYRIEIDIIPREVKIKLPLIYKNVTNMQLMHHLVLNQSVTVSHQKSIQKPIAHFTLYACFYERNHKVHFFSHVMNIYIQKLLVLMKRYRDRNNTRLDRKYFKFEKTMSDCLFRPIQPSGGANQTKADPSIIDLLSTFT